jgi:hypothetical protein
MPICGASVPAREGFTDNGVWWVWWRSRRRIGDARRRVQFGEPWIGLLGVAALAFEPMRAAQPAKPDARRCATKRYEMLFIPTRIIRRR